MFQRILVPLDGSERAERALPFAARLARVTQASLVLVRVIHPHRRTGIYGSEPGVGVTSTAFEKHFSDVSAYLQVTRQAYTRELAGLHVSTDIESGDRASSIFTAARLEHVDLIVMYHHEETGLARWILKSVTQQTMRRSPVPVLILNEHGAIPPSSETLPLWRALVPLDGSERAEYALSPAASLVTALAPPGQAELRLLSVIKSHAERPVLSEQVRKDAECYLEHVVQNFQREPLASLPLKVSATAVINPDVPGTILQQASQSAGAAAPCDLIAMATHGLSGLQRLVMGSVTEELLDRAPLPLLVVRPPAADVP